MKIVPFRKPQTLEEEWRDYVRDVQQRRLENRQIPSWIPIESDPYEIWRDDG